MSSVRIREHSKKENYPYLHQCSSLPPTAAKQDAHIMPPQQQLVTPFQFNARRMPIDWRLLHGIDVSKMIRDTDLDMLERVVGIVAFGDLDGEDTCNLTDLNFLRIFRLSQLTAEYLLHVQDHLARENSQLKDEGVRGVQHLEAVRLRVREQKELLAGTNKELKRLRKTLKTYELLAEKAKEQAPVSVPALTPPAVPTPAPGEAQPAPTQAAAPVMQLDPSTAWKLEKMELQVAKDMKEEREGLLQDIAKLKAALQQLAARHQGKEEIAAAVARTRREERLAADQRLTQALQNQQQRLQQQHQQQLLQQQQQQQQQASPTRRQDSHMNVNLSDSSEVQALQRDLADALARQRDSAQQKDALELELIALKKSAALAVPRQPPARRGSQVMFGADPGSAGGQMSATAAAAEAKADRLARELEEAEEEISAMSSKMRQQDQVIAELEQGEAGPSRPSQSAPADADKATERVKADVAQLELEAQRVQLEQEDAAHPSTSSEAMQRLQQQVTHLTEEVAALEDENQRLSEVIQAESPHTEELLLHVKELQHEVTVSKAEADEARAAAEAATPRMQATSRFGETFRSFLPAARTSSTVLEVEFHPEMSPRPGPLEQGALESPKKLEELDRQEEEEEALAQALANGDMGPQDDLPPEEEEQLGYPEDEPEQGTLEQEYQEQAREARRAAREEARQAAEEGTAIEPLSAVAQRRLRLDMPHEMQGHLRPGVMSRFPHSLQDYQNTIEEMQEELQEEVAQELGSYGIDPYAEGLTDDQYTTAMAELANRRQLQLAGKEPEEQHRIHAMRNNMLWHLQNVGGRAQRTGRLLPGGQVSSSPAAVDQRPLRAGPVRASPSRASVITVTSHGLRLRIGS
ncbi:MAG: DAZ interacting 1-like [Trebouxia sp. A1-2]|nr:MAG: DAZ interacting 1-like [Trebouxia sp. A1-2]